MSTSILEDVQPLCIIGNTNCKEGKGESQFTQPRGICLNDETKELFVVDCNNHRIQVFHLQSQAFIRQIGKGTPGNNPGSLMYPVGICMDRDNNIYVADTNNHRIVKFNHLTGTFIKSFGSHGNGPGFFNCPYGLCIDVYKGELYVADYENNRIQVVDKENGNFIRFIGSGPGQQPGEFHQPIDVCIDEDNQALLVADYSNNRIQVFDMHSGEHKAVIGGRPDDINSFSGPRSVYINHASGLLFAADRENHRVQLYNKSTYEFIRHIGLGLGVNPYQFNRPMELCVDNDTGTLIVVDGYNHRVQIMELPELRKEKLRLQMMKRNESEFVLKVPATVKPSNLAVSLLIPVNSNPRIETLCEGLSVISVTKGTFEYESIIPSDFIHYFSRNSIDSSTILNEVSNVVDEPIETVKRAIELQGEVFTKLLGDLMDFNVSPNSASVVISPTLAAIQSLVRKDWIPAKLTTGSVKKIFAMMAAFDGDKTTASTINQPCLDILKAYVRGGSFNQIFIWDLLHEKLLEFSRDKSFAPDETSWIQSLCCIFDLLDHLITLKVNKKLPLCSVSSNGKLQHVEFLQGSVQLLFGSKMAPYLLGTMSDGEIVRSVSSAASLSMLESFTMVMKSLLELDTWRSRGLSNSIDEYHVLRNDFFECVLNHLKELEDQKCLKSQNKEKKIRGGRNIWDPACPFAIGDLVDCMDKEKVWFESVIVDLLPDNAIKVHFMGWGSKWDDVIPKVDIASRVAPLNSKTVNWRSELFEGGLIEIKCNDDLVNQKWMWGRVRKLNLDESWVEIAYSFSNEPVVIKRAWLYGETICPVGMHTKDKSKNAAATITKPGKRVEQIIQEKLLKKANLKEMVFYDYDDDCIESADVGQVHISSQKRPHSENEYQEDHSIFRISKHFFNSLLREIVFSIEDISSDAMTGRKRERLVIRQILAILYRLLSPKLFLERIIKGIYFQVAVQAKSIAAPFYTCSLGQDFSWNDVMKLSSKLSNNFSKYAEVISDCFQSVLSFPTIKFIQERIRSTINRCGFTPVANEVINKFSRNPDSLRDALGPLINGQCLHASMIGIRKFFHSIVLSATSSKIKLLMELIEDVFVKDEVERLFKSDYVKNRVASIPAYIITDPSPMLEKIRVLDGLKLRYMNHFIADHPQMLAMLQRVAFLLSKKISTPMAKSLAREIADGFNHALRKRDAVDPFIGSVPNVSITVLESLVELYQLYSYNEEFIIFFQGYYLSHFAARIIDGSNSSLSVETMTLESLLLHEKSKPLLEDVRRSMILDDSFVKYFLDRFDLDELVCDHSLEATNIVCHHGFTVLNCAQNTWPSVCKPLVSSSTLKLPPIMRHLKVSYEEFFKFHNTKRVSKAHYLNWCFGSGKVALQVFVRGYKTKILHCDELQTAALLAVADHGVQQLTIAAISSHIQLSLDVTIQVVTSLLIGKIMTLVPMLRTNPQTSFFGTDCPVEGSSMVGLNIEFLSDIKAVYSKSSLNGNYDRVEESVTQWNRSRIDAAIIRCLKASPSNLCDVVTIANFVRSNIRERDDLQDQTIYDRCQYLYNQGIILKDINTFLEHSTFSFKAESFSYFPISRDSHPNRRECNIFDRVVSTISLSGSNAPPSCFPIVESSSNESKKEFVLSQNLMDGALQYNTVSRTFLQMIIVQQPLLPAHDLPGGINILSQVSGCASQLLMSVLIQLNAAIQSAIDDAGLPFKLPQLNNVLASIKYRQWDFSAMEKKLTFHLFRFLPDAMMQVYFEEFQKVADFPADHLKLIRSNEEFQDIWTHNYSLKRREECQGHYQLPMKISLMEFFSKDLVRFDHSPPAMIPLEQRFEEKDSQEDSVLCCSDRESINDFECPPIPMDFHALSFPPLPPGLFVEQREDEQEVEWFNRNRTSHCQLLENSFGGDNESMKRSERTFNSLIDHVQQILLASKDRSSVNASRAKTTNIYTSDTKVRIGNVLLDELMRQCPHEILQQIWWYDSDCTSVEQLAENAFKFLNSQSNFNNPHLKKKFKRDSFPLQTIWEEVVCLTEENQDNSHVEYVFQWFQTLEQVLSVHWSVIANVLSCCAWNIEIAVNSWFSNKLDECHLTSSFYSGADFHIVKKGSSGIDPCSICESCGHLVPLHEFYCPKRCIHYACKSCWNGRIEELINSTDDDPSCHGCICANCDTVVEIDFVFEIGDIELTQNWLRKILRNALLGYRSSCKSLSPTPTITSLLHTDLMKCSLCQCQIPSSRRATNKNNSLSSVMICQNDNDDNFSDFFHLESKTLIDVSKESLEQILQAIKTCEQLDHFNQLTRRYSYFELALECIFLIDHLQKRLDKEGIDLFSVLHLHQLLLTNCLDDKTVRAMQRTERIDCLDNKHAELLSKSLVILRLTRKFLTNRMFNNQQVATMEIMSTTYRLIRNDKDESKNFQLESLNENKIEFGEFSTRYLEIMSVDSTMQQLLAEKKLQQQYVANVLNQLDHVEDITRDQFLDLLWQLKEALQALVVTGMSFTREKISPSLLESHQLEILFASLDYSSSDTDAFALLLDCLQFYLQGRIRWMGQHVKSSQFIQTLQQEAAVLESALPSVVDLFTTTLDIYNYQYRAMSMQCIRTLQSYLELLTLLRNNKEYCNPLNSNVVVEDAIDLMGSPAALMKLNIVIDSANLLVTILLKERNYYTEQAIGFLSSNHKPLSASLMDDSWSCISEHNLVSQTMISFIEQCNGMLISREGEEIRSMTGARRVASDDRLWMEFSASLISIVKSCCAILPKSETCLAKETASNLGDSTRILCHVVNYILINHSNVLHAKVVNTSKWGEPVREGDTTLLSMLIDGVGVMVYPIIQVVHDHEIVDIMLNTLVALLGFRLEAHSSREPNNGAQIGVSTSSKIPSTPNREVHPNSKELAALNRNTSKEIFEGLALLLSKSLKPKDSESGEELHLTVSRLCLIAKTLSKYFASCGNFSATTQLCLESTSILPLLLRKREDLGLYFRSTNSVLEKSQWDWSQYYLDKVIQDLRTSQQMQLQASVTAPSTRSPRRFAVLDLYDGQPPTVDATPSAQGQDTTRRDAIQALMRRQQRPRRVPVNHDNLQPMMRAFLDHLLLDRVLMDLNTLQTGERPAGVDPGVNPNGVDAAISMAAMMLLQGQEHPMGMQQNERDDSTIELESQSDSSASSVADQQFQGPGVEVLEIGEEQEEDIMNLRLPDFRFPQNFPHHEDDEV